MCQRYVVRVQGHVDGRYFAWCDGLSISHTDGGETVLAGAFRDQAHLHGLLAQIRDLSLPLISLNLQEGLSTDSSVLQNPQDKR